MTRVTDLILATIVEGVGEPLECVRHMARELQAARSVVKAALMYANANSMDEEDIAHGVLLNVVDAYEKEMSK